MNETKTLSEVTFKLPDYTIKRLSFSVKALLVFVLGIYAIVSFWLYWPYNPMEIKCPIRIVNDVVSPGDMLVYELDMKKHSPISARISKQLVNDFVITYSPIIGNLPAGNYVRKFSIPIPTYAQPGTYVFKWQGEYKVNPFETITVIATSDQFDIVPITGDMKQ